MSEIKEFLKISGFTEEEAEKTYNRWYIWLNKNIKPKNVDEHFKAVEDSDYSEAVSLEGIDVCLICPHHLLPVEMIVDISYKPNGKIIGLSKLPRIAQDLAGSMTQEKYTDLLKSTIWEKLNPKALSIKVEGTHSCMRVRGVKSKDVVTTTYGTKYEND